VRVGGPPRTRPGTFANETPFLRRWAASMEPTACVGARWARRVQTWKARPAAPVAHLAWRSSMSTNTILIVLLLVFLFGGGGFYWSRRR